MGSVVVCIAISFCFDILVDDAERVYDQPRVADACFRLYVGFVVVHLRCVVAQGGNPAILEGCGISLPLHSGYTRFFAYQHHGSYTE